jgi:uncharacterized protein (TIGR03083 family)
MEHATHLEHLRDDSAALLAAYRAEPTAPVACCPGWDRTELLAHTAGVHAWVRAQLATGPGERIRLSTVEGPPEGEALPDWYEAGAAELIDGLATMDVAAMWPTWAGPQPGTFFPRRMAQETAIHRRDADPSPLDPAFAVDGVDELLELFVPRLPTERLAEARGSIHLHATDADGEWLVHLSPDGVTFEHGHAKGDVAVRAAAGDLLLWAWNRAEVDDRFEVFGDADLLNIWSSAVVV